VQTVRYGMRCLLAIALIRASLSAAQTLNAPGLLESFPAVAQFGLPSDSTFVFCQSQECPARSMKHIAVSPRSIETPGS
jgi:hypothetical protein